MENKSGLRPLGRAVLVLPDSPKEQRGKIVLPESIKERQHMLEQKVTVVEVGPEAWKEESVPRAQAGDRVIVAQYSGYLAQGTADDQLYRFVNDRDIFAAVTQETRDE